MMGSEGLWSAGSGARPPFVSGSQLRGGLSRDRPDLIQPLSRRLATWASRQVTDMETRCTELRLSVVAEKDKQFHAEKLELESRLRSGAQADLDNAERRFQARLEHELKQQRLALQVQGGCVWACPSVALLS